MKLIKHFLMIFSVMFTITGITYYIFNKFSGDYFFYVNVAEEIFGLAFIFAVLIVCLDLLSNKIKWLNGMKLASIQYIIFLGTIVLWASYFNWGDWTNRIYVAIFVTSFSLIYVFICLMLNTKYKKEDEDILEKLKQYQKKVY